ncbi:MAG: helix-turn-helix domain-containing protein [Candidatus Scalinduaceae bacterium]
MEQSTKELLGERIKELRKIRRLTQDQLSQKIDIDPKHLSRIEVGRSFPSLDTLEKLANVLQVELSVFFEFSHKAKSSRELKKIISELLKGADEDKLRLVVKVLKALLR